MGHSFGIGLFPLAPNGWGRVWLSRGHKERMGRLLKKNELLRLVNNFVYDSLLPLNINYFYNFGSLLGLCLIIQILSGIFLAMYYVPNINYAFDSVEYLMREVPNGWLIRYIHSNGASLFFIMVYLHIVRGLLYGSYIGNRRTV